MSTYDNEEQLFEEFRAMLVSYHKSNDMDLVPHMVMSHGFIEWHKLLAATGFKSLTWRGEANEDHHGDVFQIHMHFLFRRFWIGLMRGVDLPHVEKEYYLITGWKAFLRD